MWTTVISPNLDDSIQVWVVFVPVLSPPMRLIEKTIFTLMSFSGQFWRIEPMWPRSWIVMNRPLEDRKSAGLSLYENSLLLSTLSLIHVLMFSCGAEKHRKLTLINLFPRFNSYRFNLKGFMRFRCFFFSHFKFYRSELDPDTSHRSAKLRASSRILTFEVLKTWMYPNITSFIPLLFFFTLLLQENPRIKEIIWMWEVQLQHPPWNVWG